MANSILLLDDGLDKARVTAGVPSLSPFARAMYDYRGSQLIKTRALTAIAEQKKAAAAKPDSRPSQNPEAQLGRVMHSRDIIIRLHKLNPDLVFIRSKAFPKVMGIYRHIPGANANDPDVGLRGLQHVCGFEFGHSPEFTIINQDGDPVLRGWRKVLADLIRNRLITLSAAEKAFNITSGPESRNWQMLTQ